MDDGLRERGERADICMMAWAQERGERAGTWMMA